MQMWETQDVTIDIADVQTEEQLKGKLANTIADCKALQKFRCCYRYFITLYYSRDYRYKVEYINSWINFLFLSRFY